MWEGARAKDTAVLLGWGDAYLDLLLSNHGVLLVSVCAYPHESLASRFGAMAWLRKRLRSDGRLTRTVLDDRVIARRCAVLPRLMTCTREQMDGVGLLGQDTGRESGRSGHVLGSRNQACSLRFNPRRHPAEKGIHSEHP